MLLPMNSPELNCSWNFPTHPQNGSLVGPNEPMSENFKKTPYASIVREAIQNSLDERFDKDKPLEMTFSIKEIDVQRFSNFFDIKDHIKGCLDFYKDDKDVYQPMLDYLKFIEDNGSKLPYIQISDYNANGMHFNMDNPTDPKSPFVAFVRAAGLSTKTSQNAGGSFGFGKAAYFYLSPIRTILVSTLTKDNNCFFEGVASLCTHYYKEESKMAIGYYDSLGGLPISDNNLIPRRFRRVREDRDSNSPGTDIYIMGLKGKFESLEEAKNDIYSQMTLAVLRHFWMAIYEEMLVVTIGQTVLNKESLLAEMEAAFAEEDDSSKSLYDYNPLPYLRMVINAEKQEKNHYIFTREAGDVDPDSKAILYLHKKKGANDRVLFMRSPRMLVKAENRRNKRGYYGTFICTGGFWDVLLRCIENPAHNEWDKKNFDKDPKLGRQIEKYLNQIFEFVRDKIDELFTSGNASNDTIKDLEQYLYIPTEVDEESDDFIQESILSNPTGEVKDDGSSITTDSKEIELPKTDVTQEQKGVVLQPRVATTSAGMGNYIGGHGIHKGGKGGNDRGTRYPSVTEKNDKDGSEKKSLYIIPVTYRSFAQIENGKLMHNLIIHSDYDVENGRIDLKVGTEENDDIINVVWADQGLVRDNTVINLTLQQGVNKIKVRFADNMKHSIKLDTYEIK